MSQPTIKKPYLTELEILRAFGILAVIMIHSTSSAVVTYDPHSMLFMILATLNNLSRFAVPLFILISGLTLFYNYKDKPFNLETVKTFYMKRITKLLLPFLIFSLIYYAVIIYSRHGFTSTEQFLSYFLTWDFFVKLAIGKTYAHMYFIFIIIQCYLLFPLIWYILRRWPKTVKWLIVAGLVVQWLYMLNAKDMGIKYVTSGFFAYSLYFCIGAYMGLHYTEVQQYGERNRKGMTLRFALISLCAIFGAFNVMYAIRKAQEKIVITDLWFIELKNELYITVSCLLLIQLALWIKGTRLAYLKKTLLHLGNASFGIYLIHPLFLRYYRMMEVSEEPLIYGAWIAGGFILALLGSWIIVTWASKVKGHWILFGPISLKR